MTLSRKREMVTNEQPRALTCVVCIDYCIFSIFLANGNDNVNIIHWNSPRTPRRAHSTEKAELMGLDQAFRAIQHISKILYSLVRRTLPVVAYIDCDTLWLNLMKETVPTIPEIGYRCRKAITSSRVHSVCLISANINPADGLTKARPNRILDETIKSNKLRTPPKRVFMLQESSSRHSTFIPTSSIPMQVDKSSKPDGSSKHD